MFFTVLLLQLSIILTNILVYFLRTPHTCHSTLLRAESHNDAFELLTFLSVSIMSQLKIYLIFGYFQINKLFASRQVAILFSGVSSQQ